MPDGTVNKCKECNKKDNKCSNGNVERKCTECKKVFYTTKNEVNRRGGGGFTCSRVCFYKRLPKVIQREEKSPNWKGDKAGKGALHNWVEKKLGKDKKCEHCGTEDPNKYYDWSNISQKYLRDIKDWQRLCRACHTKYDYPVRIKKYRETIKKRQQTICQQ